MSSDPRRILLIGCLRYSGKGVLAVWLILATVSSFYQPFAYWWRVALKYFLVAAAICLVLYWMAAVIELLVELVGASKR